MDTYIVSLFVMGLAGLAVSWIPHLASKINISYSLIFLAVGILIYKFVPNLPWVNPYRDQKYVMHLTEMIVIIALMGTGLKIDKPFNLSQWNVPFRLLLLPMVLSIIAMALFGFYALGFSVASAVLLGAVLAPTDPVLASDVQVDGPMKGDKSEVKFALTAEAGMNDGMAFPFVWMAIAMALSADTHSQWLGQWFLKDFVMRIGLGVLIGFVVGRIIVYFFFKLPKRHNVLHVRDGLVAISATLMTYGITELFHGYGFIAVFICALTIRNHELNHEYHKKLHQFIDQVERLLLAILLMLFGGSLVSGILGSLTWPMAVGGLLFIFVIRPVAAYVSLMGVDMSPRRKAAISFFGIRGVGSFFYLAFALNVVEFSDLPQLWSMTAFIVLISIICHGFTAPLIMKRLH